MILPYFPSTTPDELTFGSRLLRLLVLTGTLALLAVATEAAVPQTLPWLRSLLG